MTKKKIGKTKFIIDIGDVTSQNVDAVVNWTVPTLNGGDPVFVKIHEEGGSTIYKNCQAAILNYRETNQTHIPVTRCVVTSAGILPCKKLIHAILPNYRSRDEEENRESLLRETLTNIFLLTRQYQNDIKKIVLSPVAIKIYGDDPKSAARIVIASILEQIPQLKLRVIKIICSNNSDYELYTTEFFKQAFPWYKRWTMRFFDF